VEIPDPLALGLLVLAAWRTFQLLAADDILDTPRRQLVAHLSEYWEDFLSCVFCFGWWVSVAWWASWQIWPHGTLVVAVPFAISTLVIATAKLVSSED
jgi:hypothetical protein